MTSTYMISRTAPETYGGQHDDYVRRKDEVISLAVQMIRSDASDPKALFNKIFNGFAYERWKIAKDHGSKDAEYFGHVRRKVKDQFSYTILNNAYSEYGERLRKQLKDDVDKGRLKIRGKAQPAHFLKEVLKVDPDGMYFITKNISITIDDTNYRLSKYFTCFVGSIDDMVADFEVIVIHQDSQWIEGFLEKISEVYQQAIQWTGYIDSLMQMMALFRYEFAHCMPFHRGSAAIAEWMETAIYRYHGFENFDYNPDKMVDLEALISNYDDFLLNYPSMITGVSNDLNLYYEPVRQ